jgi:parvulin-like peptidyl-prolyl isomerase
MLILVMAAVVVAPGCYPAWGGEPEIVARVNGDPVARSQWQRMIADPVTRRLYQRETGIAQPEPRELSRWVLQQLINQRLTFQEADRRGITAAEQEVDRSVTAWRGRFKGAAKFQKWLRARALDERSLRETIRTDLLVSRVRAALLEGVQVPDEEVQSYYEAHKDELRVPEQVRLRIIAVKDKAAADDIVAAVHKGEEFDRLARERSMESRAVQAGDRRWVSLQELPAPLREAVRPLKPGEISSPLQGSAESIVVRLEERRPARPKTLNEARPEIEQRLLPERQREVLLQWLAEQERKSKIEILLRA